MMSEAVLKLAEQEGALGLYELAALYANKALELGRSRQSLWSSIQMATTTPLQLKARALFALRRHREALTVLDLGLAIDPTDEIMHRLRVAVCAQLGVLE